MTMHPKNVNMSLKYYGTPVVRSGPNFDQESPLSMLRTTNIIKVSLV